MTQSAQNNCNVGRAVAYTVYSVGASVLIGLARVIVAIAYIVKHALNAHVAVNAQRVAEGKERAESDTDLSKRVDKSMDRYKENRAATREADKAKGATKVLKTITAGLTKAKNVIGEAKDDLLAEGTDLVRTVKHLPQRLVVHAFVTTERQMMSEWQAELVRGLAEMSVIGAAVFTYRDNFAGRKVSPLSFEEVIKRIDDEKGANALIKQFVPSYDPLF